MENDPLNERLTLTSRSAWADAGNRALRRDVDSGRLVRLRRGVMREQLAELRTLAWAQRPAELRRRYLERTVAVAATRQRPAVFSHYAALAIHDLPLLDSWPLSVDITEPGQSRRRSKNGVVVHRSILPEDSDTAEWFGGHFVTTPAQTVIDLARAGDFMAAVVALDFALSERATPALRLSKDEVATILERYPRWGSARALAAIEFADGRSGSPGESGSRVRFSELGFVIPELQVRHPAGALFYDTDFEWTKTSRGRRVIGEFDGLAKYLKPEYLGAMTSGEAVVAEKRREDLLRLEGADFARWGMAEVRNPARLAAILDRNGVPRARRRAK